MGNYTAINIIVRDTLSQNVDISSFRNIQSSHKYQYTLDPISRLLEFKFQNIKLVDSLANEEESHGFVKFDILTIQGLIDYEFFENKRAHVNPT